VSPTKEDVLIAFSFFLHQLLLVQYTAAWFTCWTKN